MAIDRYGRNIIRDRYHSHVPFEEQKRIIESYSTGTISVRKLAQQFHRHPDTVSRILNSNTNSLALNEKQMNMVKLPEWTKGAVSLRVAVGFLEVALNNEASEYLEGLKIPFWFCPEEWINQKEVTCCNCGLKDNYPGLCVIWKRYLEDRSSWLYFGCCGSNLCRQVIEQVIHRLDKEDETQWMVLHEGRRLLNETKLWLNQSARQPRKPASQQVDT